MTDEPNINLLAQNAMRDEMDFFHFRVPGDGADGTGFVEPGEVAVRTIRCQSWRTYTMGYQIAILLTNRQTYREAWGIFQLQNVWTLVRFNKVGVGKEMKDRGFPVASGDNLWRRVKFPVMKRKSFTLATLAHRPTKSEVLTPTLSPPRVRSEYDSSELQPRRLTLISG